MMIKLSSIDIWDAILARDCIGWRIRVANTTRQCIKVLTENQQTTMWGSIYISTDIAHVYGNSCGRFMEDDHKTCRLLPHRKCSLSANCITMGASVPRMLPGCGDWCGLVSGNEHIEAMPIWQVVLIVCSPA